MLIASRSLGALKLWLLYSCRPARCRRAYLFRTVGDSTCWTPSPSTNEFKGDTWSTGIAGSSPSAFRTLQLTNHRVGWVPWLLLISLCRWGWIITQHLQSSSVIVKAPEVQAVHLEQCSARFEMTVPGGRSSAHSLRFSWVLTRPGVSLFALFSHSFWLVNFLRKRPEVRQKVHQLYTGHSLAKPNNVLNWTHVIDCRILASNACRGAIMFGDTLSDDNAKQLIKTLSTCAFPFQCEYWPVHMYYWFSVDQFVCTVDLGLPTRDLDYLGWLRRTWKAICSALGWSETDWDEFIPWHQ